jgi:hypothetical protein
MDLWAMADLVTPMAVRVAATLRIADHIAGGVQTAPELAEAANVHAETLDRLLRHLATLGVLSRNETDQYALTALGDALRDDHPFGVRARLDIEVASAAPSSRSCNCCTPCAPRTPQIPLTRTQICGTPHLCVGGWRAGSSGRRWSRRKWSASARGARRRSSTQPHEPNGRLHQRSRRLNVWAIRRAQHGKTPKRCWRAANPVAWSSLRCAVPGDGAAAETTRRNPRSPRFVCGSVGFREVSQISLAWPKILRTSGSKCDRGNVS